MNKKETNKVPTFSSYERSTDRENHYGTPNFTMWALYGKCSPKIKISIVIAFHLICHSARKDIDFARSKLNTYTLALYKKSGKYTAETLKDQEYSQPYYFGWIYGTDPCREKNESVREKRLKEVKSILESEWAAAVIDDFGTTTESVREKLRELELIRSSTSR